MVGDFAFVPSGRSPGPATDIRQFASAVEAILRVPRQDKCIYANTLITHIRLRFGPSAVCLRATDATGSNPGQEVEPWATGSGS